MQYTKTEINAAIANVMQEKNLHPPVDYIDDSVDSDRFIEVAEAALRDANGELDEAYITLCEVCQSKVIALVSVLRLIERQ